MTAGFTSRAFRAPAARSVGVSNSLLLGLLLRVGIISLPNAHG